MTEVENLEKQFFHLRLLDLVRYDVIIIDVVGYLSLHIQRALVQ